MSDEGWVDDGWGDDGGWSDPGSWRVEREEERLRRGALAEMKSLGILAKDLKEFYLSKELSDVQIKCGDQTFDAHQFILSARSPVFRRMLQTEMKEKKTGVVNLGGTSSEVVSELLKFIYTGSCCVNNDYSMLCELLEAADKYELENLKDVLALSTKLTKENSLQYLALGDMYEAKTLKKRTLAFIVRKRHSVVGSKEWKECAKNRPHLFVEIAEAFAKACL